MPFRSHDTALTGVKLIEPVVFEDERGWFKEWFEEGSFGGMGLPARIVQINQSFSRKTVLRGLHFQRPPMAQGKIVGVLRGAVFDVAVDIRSGSPTFGRWIGEILSDTNHRMLVIPEGFAHGFCVLSDEALVMYGCTKGYSPEHEGGIRYDDPVVGVDWPVSDPIVSAKDRSWPSLDHIKGVFA